MTYEIHLTRTFARHIKRSVTVEADSPFQAVWITLQNMNKRGVRWEVYEIKETIDATIQ